MKKQENIVQVIPSPDEIYLMMKQKFADKQDKVEKLYALWAKDESIEISEKIEVKQKKFVWVKYLLWFIMFLSISVFLDKIYPFYPEHIRELLSDNIGRFVVLFILVLGVLISIATLKTMKGEDLLAPNRVYYSYEFHKNIKKATSKKKNIRTKFNAALFVFMLISLFMLGYVWTIIIPVIISGVMLLFAIGMLESRSKETKKAFDEL